MERENKIIRRYKQRLRCQQKKISFDLENLRKEIFQLQNGKNIENMFGADLEEKEDFSYVR